MKKNWKIGHFGKKFLKRDITSSIRAWYWNLMVLTSIQIYKPSSLEYELEGARLVEEELGKKRVPWTKTMDHEGEYHNKDKMEYLQHIIPYF